MATKDDIVDFANRGVDQMFPARRIARMAGLTSATQALNKAKQGATEEEFNNAMSKAEKTSAANKEVVAEHLKNSIFKKFTPTSMDKEYKKGGKVSSASKRADGIAQRGKTRGKMY